MGVSDKIIVWLNVKLNVRLNIKLTIIKDCNVVKLTFYLTSNLMIFFGDHQHNFLHVCIHLPRLESKGGRVGGGGGVARGENQHGNGEVLRRSGPQTQTTLIYLKRLKPIFTIFTFFTVAYG